LFRSLRCENLSAVQNPFATAARVLQSNVLVSGNLGRGFVPDATAVVFNSCNGLPHGFERL
jgi:hypothetical protein